jgi:hypothetical protein
LTVSAEPQPGDLIVYRERGVHSGPCRFGAFGTATVTAAPTYAEALRRANRLAVSRQVDLWTSHRVRWADAVGPSFERVTTHRPQAQQKAY